MCIPFAKTFSLVPRSWSSVKVKVIYKGHIFKKRLLWGISVSQTCAKPHSSVGSVWGFEKRRSLVRSPAGPIFFPRIDDSHCGRIHSSLTAVCCFDNSHVGQQPVAWKEYCAEYWLTLSQMANIRLFQTERVHRRQF